MPENSLPLSFFASDLSIALRLRADPVFQGALERYAHAGGSSEAVAVALLTAARYFTQRAVLTSAMQALRSYEFGNASPDLARATADACELALQLAPSGAEAARG
ncbi:MAG: hypothetical protein DI527_18180 [Chelatococcus sp.]|nr:MAG: hypothetical protein DI527_18180 [Chelatococcus sp.]